MFDRCDWRRFRCRSRDLIGDCRSTDAEMDFDDHDDPEEEIGLPVGSGYEPQLGNSGRSASGGGKVAGGGGGGGGEGGMVSAGAAAGSSNRKVSGGGGGGRYRECLKNHAVSIGGHAVDGCGEFMAAGEEGTLDALRCAACGCHRNFHRKEVEGGGLAGAGAIGAEYHHQFSPYYRTPAAYLHPHHHMAAAAVAQQQHRPSPLALPSTSDGGGHSRDDQEDISNLMMGGGLKPEEEGEWRRGELTEGRAARSREEKNIAAAATEGKKGREGRLPGGKEDHLEEKITTGISRRMLE